MDHTVQNHTGQLTGKRALVTGSTNGIGRAIAIAFAAEGADVVVSGRDAARGGEVVRAANATGGGRAVFVRADLDGSKGASNRLADEAAASLGGPIDVLVNNAGIYPAATTTSIDEDTIDRIFAVNVKAPIFLTAAIAPGMAERGHGAIVNLGSWVARLGIDGGSVYSASKGALETLTRAWAAEFGPRGVRVNTVSPGVTRADGETIHRADVMMRGTPGGASGSAHQIAKAAVFLASDAAEFIHGATIDVDGGRTTVAVIAG